MTPELRSSIGGWETMEVYYNTEAARQVQILTSKSFP